MTMWLPGGEYTYQDVTPGTKNAWVDVDVSAYIPEYASGVILHIVNEGTLTGQQREIGFRKNGSTDNLHPHLFREGQCFAFVGVDENKIFEAYIEKLAEGTPFVAVYLCGYFQNDAWFFTNAVDKSTATTSTWVDVDISASTGGDTATAAICQLVNANEGSTYNYGLRKNGSTFDLWDRMFDTTWAIVGCDGGEIFEQKIANAVLDLYVVGYVKGTLSVWDTNPVDHSIGSTETWVSLSAQPAGSNIAVFWGHSTDDISRKFALRKSGAAEEFYLKLHQGAWLASQLDYYRVCEAKIDNLACDLYRYGYFLRPIQTLAPAGISSAQAFGTPGMAWLGFLQPSSVASAEAFGTAQAEVWTRVDASSIASLEAFGGASAQPGAVYTQPNAMASLEAFGDVGLSVGAVTLSPGAMASLEAMGVVSVQPGPVVCAPASIASLQALGDPSVAAFTPIGVESISSEEAFGQAQAMLMLALLSPNGIATAESFGQAEAMLMLSLIGTTSIASQEGFEVGAELIPGMAYILPDGADSAGAFGSLTTGLTTSMYPYSTESAEAFGAALVKLMLTLLYPDAVGTQEAFGSASLATGAVGLSPNGFLGGESFGTASLLPGPTYIAATSFGGEVFGAAHVASWHQMIYPTGAASAQRFGLTLVKGGAYVSPLQLRDIELAQSVLSDIRVKDGLLQ